MGQTERDNYKRESHKSLVFRTNKGQLQIKRENSGCDG